MRNVHYSWRRPTLQYERKTGGEYRGVERFQERIPINSQRKVNLHYIQKKKKNREEKIQEGSFPLIEGSSPSRVSESEAVHSAFDERFVP